MIKKILTSALLVTAFSSLLTAEVVFDLGAQQLYYCVTDKTNSDGSKSNQYVESTYDTGKALVSTGLVSEYGYYRPPNAGSGHFAVSIKTPRPNTAVTFSMYCFPGDNDGCSVELLSANGQATSILFTHDTITVNGAVKTDDTFSNGATSINGSIEITPVNIEIIINGKHKFILDKQNFNLKKINTALYTEGSNNIVYIDKLINMVISTDY